MLTRCNVRDDVVDEREIHLRDVVDESIFEDHSRDDAFEIALTRLGPTDEGTSEIRTIAPTHWPCLPIR
jgi:hypothetical protein